MVCVTSGGVRSASRRLICNEMMSFVGMGVEGSCRDMEGVWCGLIAFAWREMSNVYSRSFTKGSIRMMKS